MTVREKEALRRANAALHRRREIHARQTKRRNKRERAEWAYFVAVATLALTVFAFIAFAAGV